MGVETVSYVYVIEMLRFAQHENRGAGIMFENVYCIILMVLSVSISSFMESL